MALPPDIQQRIQKAKANGFTDAQIQADLQRKYGVSSLPAQAPSLPKAESLTEVGGGLGTAGQIAGVKHIGELIGSLGLFNSKDKKKADASAQALQDMNQKLIAHAMSLPPGERRTQLLQQAQRNGAEVSAYEGSINKSAPTGKQIAGDVGQLALTAVGMKAPVGSGLVRSQSVGGKAVAGLGRQIALSKIPQAIALGGASGATEAFGQGKSGKEIAKAGLTSGLTSGAVTGAFGLIGKLSNLLTNKAPKAIYGTSTRLEERINPEYAIKNNITGSRTQIEEKLKPEFARIEEAIKASPNAHKTIDVRALLDDPQFKKLYQQAKDGGEANAVETTVRKLFPQLFEATPAQLDDLAAKAAGEYADPKAMDAFTKAFEDKVAADKPMDVLAAVGKRRAIQRFTPQGVMRGLPSSSAEAEAKDTLRAGLNKLIYDAAPDVQEQMGNDQVLTAVANAMNKMGNRPRTLPGINPSLIQKTVLAPAIGTRLAREMYRSGAAGRALESNPELQKALRALLLREISLAQ